MRFLLFFVWVIFELHTVNVSIDKEFLNDIRWVIKYPLGKEYEVTDGYKELYKKMGVCVFISFED